MAVRTAKQRIALQKAQAASARKRKGHGKGKRIAKRVAVGAAVVAAGAVVAHHGVKETKLKKKHGDDYLRPGPHKAHHFTLHNDTARKIAKKREFKSSGANGGHGKSDATFFTLSKHDKTQKHSSGEARVTTSINRRDVVYHIPHGNQIKGTSRGHHHVQVANSTLKGKRVTHNLPKSAHGVRKAASKGLAARAKRAHSLGDRYAGSAMAAISEAQARNPKERAHPKPRKKR